MSRLVAGVAVVTSAVAVVWAATDVSAEEARDVEPKIAGGQLAEDGRFPWMAAITTAEGYDHDLQYDWAVVKLAEPVPDAEPLPLAATDDEEVNACPVDSGGPLMAEVDGRTVLAGIVSWGSDCYGTPAPGVHASVGAQIDDIRAAVDEVGGKPPACR